MEHLEQQIHLRNIISCLTEISDYSHYLSYDQYLVDEELKKIILSNLTLAAKEAQSLYKKGTRIEGLEYLVGLTNAEELEKENFALYSLLQNDIDYLKNNVRKACDLLMVQESRKAVPTYA